MSTSRKSDTEYRQIDCSLFDQLELLAVQAKEISIKYKDLGDKFQLENVVIDTTVIRDGKEYLKLVSGELIRLDELEVVDGIEFIDNAASGDLRR